MKQCVVTKVARMARGTCLGLVSCAFGLVSCKPASQASISSGGTSPTGDAPQFNAIVLQVVQELLASDTQLGYSMTDATGQHTRSLSWGGIGFFNMGSRRSHCSGATLQTFMMAVERAGGLAAASVIPARSWKWTPAKECWYAAGQKCQGARDAMVRFGLGDAVTFPNAQAGDFLDFDRLSRMGKRSGHSVVFLGFVNADGVVTPDYGPDVVGFEYFSSNGPTKGLGKAKAHCREHGDRPGWDNGVVCNTLRIGRGRMPSEFRSPDTSAPPADSLSLSGDASEQMPPAYYNSERFLSPGE